MPAFRVEDLAFVIRDEFAETAGYSPSDIDVDVIGTSPGRANPRKIGFNRRTPASQGEVGDVHPLSGNRYQWERHGGEHQFEHAYRRVHVCGSGYTLIRRIARINYIGGTSRGLVRMSDQILLFEIAWDGDDVKNVVDSVTRGGYWANGPYIDRFEEEREEYHQVDHAVVFNSETTALASALRALDVGDGDEVIVPSFRFISTVNVVKIVGATPVFADIERTSYGLDPNDARERITNDTAAILPVHYAGKPCQIEALRSIVDEHDLLLVENAAEALGVEVGDQKVGTFGDAGMLSFCQNKIVATGEGGAVLTDDETARDLRLLRSHGRASSEYFDSASGGDYVTLGNNYRMTDVVASTGVAQMEKVESTLIDGRRRAATRLSNR
jgi:perosamine synthetase